MLSISLLITTFINVASAVLFHTYFFLSSFEKKVNQMEVNISKNKHCLIETNSFLIGEFTSKLNTDWMERIN